MRVRVSEGEGEGEGEDEDEDEGAICGLFKAGFGSVFQVGVPLAITSVSSLSLRERARVRGF